MKKSECIKTAITSVIINPDLAMEEKIETLAALYEDLNHAQWREKREAEEAVASGNGEQESNEHS